MQDLIFRKNHWGNNPLGLFNFWKAKQYLIKYLSFVPLDKIFLILKVKTGSFSIRNKLLKLLINFNLLDN